MTTFNITAMEYYNGRIEPSNVGMEERMERILVLDDAKDSRSI